MLETGPPIGIPVQLRIYGDDIQTLRELAAQVKARMRSIPGTIDVHDDWGDPVFQMTLKIDSDRAALSGLTNQDVATTVGTGLSGLVDQPAPRARQAHRHRAAAAALRSGASWTTCSASTWSTRPAAFACRCSQLASFERQIITPKIRRRDHERCITVRCDAVHRRAAQRDRQATPATCCPRNRRQRRRTAANAIAFPTGYRWEFGGEKFEQDKGFKSLTIALIVSFVAIYLALVVQFNSVDSAAARLRGRALRRRRRADRPCRSSARRSASWRSSASRRWRA